VFREVVIVNAFLVSGVFCAGFPAAMSGCATTAAGFEILLAWAGGEWLCVLRLYNQEWLCDNSRFRRGTSILACELVSSSCVFVR
jgi:hypothetical protein